MIQYNLSREGDQITAAATGEEALEKARAKAYDLIVLDLMLPGIDGLEVAKVLKNNDKTKLIPIVMLTAKGEASDVVTGLELGADDYITKPFSPRILVARIRAALRRKAPESKDASSIIIIHGLEIHPRRRSVSAGDRQFDLTYTEFQVLYILARSRKLGGTGLCLAIVKHIAQAHGGHITVESKLGEGSIFTLHLPAH